jgi:hypothetical protein
MNRGPCYYVGSSSRLAVLAVALLSTACASASSVAMGAPVIRFAQPPGNAGERRAQWADLGRKPVVVAFEPGDLVPVHFELDSMLVETQPHPVTFQLVASRRFFVLVSPHDRPRISLDGRDFDERHQNSFRFGISSTPAGSALDLGIAILKKSVP